MNIIKSVVIVFFLMISISSKAQYYKLLNLTEKEVLKKIKKYPIIIRDSSKHEFVPFLVFKNKNNEWQLRCTFSNKKCYLVRHVSKKKSYKSAVKKADREFIRVRKDKWKSKENTFEVFIDDIDGKVYTTFSRGVSQI